MGYFIEGLNGDSDPRLDFFQSVKYNHLSPALDAGYGVIDPFELRWIEEAGVLLSERLVSVTKEEEAMADRLIRAYAIAKESDRLFIWRNNIKSISETDPVEDFMDWLISTYDKDAALQAEEDEKKDLEDNNAWAALSSEDQELARNIFLWEQSHWADAFKYEDSPYLNRLDFKDRYDSVYSWLQNNAREDY